ncbi:hypothetical protein NDU88_006927 [Pleurodeles waltl]|uniref:Uncharacterized protein n=1 Tax=Pleurodeles waltl TaxID=8319 RepID=A0AAV7PL17_PLEWA|nr:hypothetical protein NDU88_006927 [Pleurodeles waltl]
MISLFTGAARGRARANRGACGLQLADGFVYPGVGAQAKKSSHGLKITQANDMAAPVLFHSPLTVEVCPAQYFIDMYGIDMICGGTPLPNKLDRSLGDSEACVNCERDPGALRRWSGAAAAWNAPGIPRDGAAVGKRAAPIRGATLQSRGPRPRTDPRNKAAGKREAAYGGRAASQPRRPHLRTGPRGRGVGQPGGEKRQPVTAELRRCRARGLSREAEQLGRRRRPERPEPRE